MTDKLPPNLLKLFAPRPQLPYLRPVDKEIVDAVGHIIAQLRGAKTAGLFSAAADSDAMEEGEEPSYTHAEEIKRQIRREERKNLKSEQFKIATETCLYIVYCDLRALFSHFFSPP